MHIPSPNPDGGPAPEPGAHPAVAVLGTGTMGAAMARVLLAAGFARPDVSTARLGLGERAVGAAVGCGAR